MTPIDRPFLRNLLKTRENDSHKHQYGHALIVAGCRTMPGAALMATGAALKSGCGLVTLHSTENATNAAIVRYPSAMLSIESQDCFCTLPDRVEKYTSIGIGPGLGIAPETAFALEELMGIASENEIPMVLDADALNIISSDTRFLCLIPKGSVLTPHEGEARRLFHVSGRDELEKMAREFCLNMGVTIVMKGFHTRVVSPAGEIYENTTGNPGMAKGGSGDVLTGLISGLVARGYSGLDASLLGVWIHGYAGDCLSEERTHSQ